MGGSILTEFIRFAFSILAILKQLQTGHVYGDQWLRSWGNGGWRGIQACCCRSGCFNWALEAIHIGRKLSSSLPGMLRLLCCWEIWIKHWHGREYLLVRVLKRSSRCRWHSERYRSYTRVTTMRIWRIPPGSSNWGRVKHLLTVSWVLERINGYWGQRWLCQRARKSHFPVTVH